MIPPGVIAFLLMSAWTISLTLATWIFWPILSVITESASGNTDATILLAVAVWIGGIAIIGVMAWFMNRDGRSGRSYVP